MTITTISSLPTAPSRISDPDNLGIESLAFLSSLSNFVSDFNQYAADINALPLNVYDWGALDAVTSLEFLEGFRPFLEMPDALNSGMNGRELVVNMDNFLLALKGTDLTTSRGFVAQVNRASPYFQQLSSSCTISVSDTNRPILVEISNAPTQAQPESDFIARCLTFFPSVKSAVEKVVEFEEFIYQKMVDSEDWNNESIADAFEDYEG